MGRSIKVCIIGAGSSYTPELIDGFLNQPINELPVSVIHLYDIDAKRLKIMADLAKRMIIKKKHEVTIKCSTQLDEAVEGSDFIITQLRVGGMQARYLDESIPLKYGIIGQETTGPGGMFKAVRTIPHMLKIAHTVEKLAPEAFILNYTNPSGIITEAVIKYSKARIIGLCSGIPVIQKSIRLHLDKIYPDVKTYCVGLNHLGFIYRIIDKNRDITKEAIDYLYDKGKLSSILGGDKDLAEVARLINAIPITYLCYYFFKGRELKKMLDANETRAQKIMKIEKEVFEEASLPETFNKPLALKKRGGGGYSEVTFAAMSAIYDDSGAEVVSSVINNGCVEGIDNNAVIEAVCRMDKNGANPMYVGKIPLQYRGLVQAVKAYESLTIEAVVNRDKRLLKEALMNHPLVGDVDIIEPLLDEMIKAHKIQF